MRRTPRPYSVLTAILVSSLALAVATPGVAGAAAGFGDVEESRFYTDAIAWMVSEDITTGLGDGCFGPDANVTRGQTATFLHRLDTALDNEPVSGSHPFVDVDASYQQTPIGWLYESGLTTGVSAREFAPARSITRGDFAVLVWRYAGGPVTSADLPFVDITAGYQRSAVAWMAEEGITTGTSATTFSPDGLVTRGEAATFLHRFADPADSPPISGSAPCTIDLRTVLELAGFTATEAKCAAPLLDGFAIDTIVDVVEDRSSPSFDLIVAAVAVANECLTADRIGDLSRLFL
jgi:hypothetical protein